MEITCKLHLHGNFLEFTVYRLYASVTLILGYSSTQVLTWLDLNLHPCPWCMFWVESFRLLSPIAWHPQLSIQFKATFGLDVSVENVGFFIPREETTFGCYLYPNGKSASVTHFTCNFPDIFFPLSHGFLRSVLSIELRNPSTKRQTSVPWK